MKISRVMVSSIVVLLALCMPALVMAAAHSSKGCDGCHTPHHAQSMVGMPLWNGHETIAAFTPYSSTTLNASVGQPNGTAKVCLSCHDGTTRYRTTPISDPNRVFAGDRLAKMHPISFVYDSSLATADGHLKQPTESSGLGGSIAKDLLDPLGRVQCASCHDVHSTGVGNDMLRGYDFFQGADGGKLCQMCHLK